MGMDLNKFFNLSSFTEQQKAMLTGAITDLVLMRLADMVGGHLTDQQITELEAVSSSQNQDAVLDWLNKNIPNFYKGIEEVLAEESSNIARQVSALTNLVVEEKKDA